MEFESDDEATSLLEVFLLSRQRRLEQPAAHGGSRPGKRPNQARDFNARWKRFKQLYFSSNSVYNSQQFRRRFRMRRELFMRIADSVIQHDPYFQQKKDCTGKMGIHPVMKITAALRCLSYGCAADSLDETLEISETVVSTCLESFVTAIIDVFGDLYLRIPTSEDIKKLLQENANRGFPGIFIYLICECFQFVLYQICPGFQFIYLFNLYE